MDESKSDWVIQANILLLVLYTVLHIIDFVWHFIIVYFQLVDKLNTETEMDEVLDDHQQVSVV